MGYIVEPSTLFAEFVLGMCAVHLVRQVSDSITKRWMKSHPEHKMAAQYSAKKVVRGDWYVFFNCSDLVGKDPQIKQVQIRNSDNAETKKRTRRNVARV